MQGITIVTPSFNQAQYLEQCIDSILSQNYPDLEYIIMDGGSTDGSVEIIKKYEKHLSYWQSRPDGGQYQALNTGFSRSTKPIMGWLNADDMLHKGGLAAVGEVFSAFPKVEFLTGKRVGFDVNGDIASYGHIDQTWCHNLLLNKDLVRKETLFIMQEATFWRRTLWETAGSGLDTSFSLAADFELWLRMSRHAALHTVNALTGGFRCYSMEQRCNKSRDEYVEQCCLVIDRELGLNLPPAQHRATPPPLIDYPIRNKSHSFDILTRNERPKISIVTPSFNQGEYLEECIDSVLSQNYPNMEYIVMDGGSTDGSAEIIKKHARHLNYWQSRRDYGQYHAVNTGFLISTGEIMAWLNSDDKYHPGALWLLADAFESAPDIEWITGSPTLWDKDGAACGFSSKPPLWSREKYLRGEVSSPYIQQESTFWRRSLWHKAGSTLDPEFPLAADMELWARFFRHAQLHTLHAPLGGFRSHPGEGQRSEVGQDLYQREAERIVARERAIFSANPTGQLQPPPVPLQVMDVVSSAGSRITAENFGFFNYSRSIHFPYFAGCDRDLYGRAVAPGSCDIKSYQELLAYTFIRHNLPKASRILVTAAADSPIIAAAQTDYEVWSLSATPRVAEGWGTSSCRVVKGEPGSFSRELPEAYFDLVLVISPPEQPPQTQDCCRGICRDIARLVKPGGHALHCFELRAGADGFSSSPLLPFLFQQADTCHRFVPFDQAPLDPFVFFKQGPQQSAGAAASSEEPRWLSYNVLWTPGGRTTADGGNAGEPAGVNGSEPGGAKGSGLQVAPPHAAAPPSPTEPAPRGPDQPRRLNILPTSASLKGASTAQQTTAS